LGGGQKHAFQEDSAFASVDESQLERTISSDTTIPGVAQLKKRVANLSASIRQRLLNLATERKEDFGLVVTRYGLERFLYRLSVSPHRDSFVLKGRAGADGSLMCRSCPSKNCQIMRLLTKTSIENPYVYAASKPSSHRGA